MRLDGCHRQVVMRVCFLYFLILFNNLHDGVQASLNHYAFLIGDWTLNSKANPFFSFGANNNKKSLLAPRTKLSLHANGTFTLSSSQNNNNKNEEDVVHGIWSCLGNPYCLTDRFYDDLFLTSFPRSLVHVQQQQTSLYQLTKKTMITHGVLEMRCRIWGRFQKQHDRARMTHGTILWKQQQQVNNNNDENVSNQNAPLKAFWTKIQRTIQHQRQNRQLYGTFSGQILERHSPAINDDVPTTKTTKTNDSPQLDFDSMIVTQEEDDE